jgi:hypothetical protein
MNPISTLGAATSLELAIILMAAILLFDSRRNAAHRQRLWRSIKAILEQDEPVLVDPALDSVERHAA